MRLCFYCNGRTISAFMIMMMMMIMNFQRRSGRLFNVNKENADCRASSAMQQRKRLLSALSSTSKAGVFPNTATMCTIANITKSRIVICHLMK